MENNPFESEGNPHLASSFYRPSEANPTTTALDVIQNVLNKLSIAIKG